MSVPTDVASHWQEELNSVLSPDMDHVHRVLVHDEVGSTQDAARLNGMSVGDVVVGIRQTSGRGRHGRNWLDTTSLGTAMSFVLPRLDPIQLALGCAIAVAGTVESFVEEPAFIKWPNDIILLKRKVSGILIEQHGEAVIVGIGINVLHDSWPEELAGRAISLHQAGANGTRLNVMTTLLKQVDEGITRSPQDLIGEFQQRDALVGAEATVVHDGCEHQGTIQQIDPRGDLVLRSGDGDIRLPAEAVSVRRAHGERIDV